MKCIEKIRTKRAKRQAANIVAREKNVWLRGQQAHLDRSEAAVGAMTSAAEPRQCRSLHAPLSRRRRRKYEN